MVLSTVVCVLVLLVGTVQCTCIIMDFVHALLYSIVPRKRASHEHVARLQLEPDLSMALFQYYISCLFSARFSVSCPAGRWLREKVDYGDQCAAVFNLACAQALAGRTKEALESLVRLRDLGSLLRSDIDEDADLNCMQSQPWLAEFLATLTA